jgi:hypothetical protein
MSDAAFANPLTGMAEAVPVASAVAHTAMTPVTANLNLFMAIFPPSITTPAFRKDP